MAAHVAAGGIEIRRLGDDVEAAIGLEHLAQAAANDGMVVSDDDADRLGAHGGDRNAGRRGSGQLHAAWQGRTEA